MRVKFFVTPVYPYGNDHYFHEIIVLAEGFRKTGVEFFGNADYWFEKENKAYLINYSDSEDFDIAVYDYRYVKSFEHLLFRKGYPNFNFDKKHVLIDRNDWISPIWHKNNNYKIFDLILGCHTVKGFSFPDNYLPWSMGLSERMISMNDKFNGLKTKDVIGHNFRVNHNLRKLFVDQISQNGCVYNVEQMLSSSISENSLESYYYKSTTRRHSLSFYESINSSLMFLGFGGYIESLPNLYQPYSLFDKIRRKPFHLLSNYNKQKYSYVFQWDSFRMWELFNSNTCPIFLNFKKFNFILPELPNDSEHYLGLDSFSWSEFNSKLKKYPRIDVSDIGLNGKDWVLRNYSPEVIANRLISKI
jgi:hypothetical protein